MTAEDVHAIRAGAVAIVAQCDAALARMQRETMAADEARKAVEYASSCLHARLIGTGVMGAPLRRRCLDCGASMDDTANTNSHATADLEPERRT